MATLVSTPLRMVADGFVKSAGYVSAVLSGLVPDLRHLSGGGYHCSVEDLKAHGNGGDYSNIRADDKNFNPRYCAAYDVSLSRADMIKNYQRVHAVWLDRADPRRKYVNCINTWSGSGDAVRLDFVANTAKRASDDHKWHVHGEIRRRYLLDAKAARAHVSMHAGESRATWTAREEKPGGAGPVTVPVANQTPVTGHLPGSRQLQYVPGKTVLSGLDVAFVQRYIGSTRAGPADGIFGARSRVATIWYQGMRGLAADGIVGPATWRSMGVKATI